MTSIASDPEILSIRDASRRLVREWGFLHTGMDAVGLSHPQVHALLELESGGARTVVDLAQLLNLDKSTLSRTLTVLLRKGLVRSSVDKADRRRKLLALTPEGRRRLTQVHALANAQVQEALEGLTPAQRSTVREGLNTYALALGRARARKAYRIRPIQPKDDPQVARIIRTVMTEHGASGQGFAIHDPEVQAMSKAYPGGRVRYFVLEHGGRLAGGGGFAPLAGGPPRTCELRKMYFLPEARGLGLGRDLLVRALEEARKAGFAACYLETLASMGKARRLYESLGFRPLSGPMGSTGHFGCNAWYLLELGSGSFIPDRG